MEINVCIIHYNSQDTIVCLESLMRQTCPCRVVLVDNHSTDGSITHLEQYIADKTNIVLLKAPVNGGFAAGNNLALRWAKKNTPDSWNLLLNNDTYLPADFIEKLTSVAKKNQIETNSLFALGATEYKYGTEQKNHSGIHYISLPTGLAMTQTGWLRKPYICGACLLLNPAAPLLNETYFLYFEDADYGELLRQHGYQLLTTDETHYYHKVGGSTRLNPDKLRIEYTSLWHFYDLHYPKWKPIVRLFRVIENAFRGRWEVVKIIKDTYNHKNNEPKSSYTH